MNLTASMHRSAFTPVAGGRALGLPGFDGGASHRQRLRYCPLLVLALFLRLCPASEAQAVERGRVCPSTGNSYFRSLDELTVDDALLLAEQLGGTLVAIDSAEEQAWLHETFGLSDATWIGLEEPFEEWTTGATVGYSRWCEGEPNGGSREPNAVMNWGTAGCWNDVSGDPLYDFFRAIVEVNGADAAAAVIPEDRVADSEQLTSVSCAFIVAVEGLRAEDLADPDNTQFSGLLLEGAFWPDASGDLRGDVATGWGLLAWGVDWWKSSLESADLMRGDHWRCSHFLSRLERARPEVRTVSFLPSAELSGKLLGGARVDVRLAREEVWEPTARGALREALEAPGPVCVAMGWRADPTEKGKRGERQRRESILTLDHELESLLETIRSRETYDAERWLFVVTSPGSIGPPRPRPASAKRGLVDGPVSVPLLVVGEGFAPGERFDEASLADVAPTVARHFGVVPRPNWRLDGLTLSPVRVPALGENLLVNGDAEISGGWEGTWDLARIRGWRVGAWMNVSRTKDLSTAAEAAPGGRSCFSGGDGPAWMEQRVDLLPWQETIRSGDLRYRLSARLGGIGEVKSAFQVTVEFKDVRGKRLASESIGPVEPMDRRKALGAENGRARPGLLPLTVDGRVPRSARSAVVRLVCESENGGWAALADDLSLQVTGRD